MGLEAIRTLHLLIDDDHNGNVDQSESDEVSWRELFVVGWLVGWYLILLSTMNLTVIPEFRFLCCFFFS